MSATCVPDYARVSTFEQVLEVHRRRLREKAGSIRVFENVTPGKDFARLGIRALLDFAAQGTWSLLVVVCRNNLDTTDLHQAYYTHIRSKMAACRAP
jgi:DNA invertase Pin-like site-specific DNA recombinase